MSIGLIRELIKEVLHEKGEVVVYHASPQLGLKRINPKYSPKFGTEGIFVTRDLGSILRSWADWALRKPDKTRTGRTAATYENLAIYTIRIPKSVFDASEAAHERAAAASREGGLGAWGWDVETFIPESLMPDGHLTPTSVKTYSARDLENIDTRVAAWKKAGMKPPTEQILPGSGKNPAKEAYAELSEKIKTAALKRGGPIGEPSGWKWTKEHGYPQEKLSMMMGRLYDLAKKPRLDRSGTSELQRLVSDIEDIIDIPVKSLPSPPAQQAPKLTDRTEKRPHLYRRSPDERRDGEV